MQNTIIIIIIIVINKSSEINILNEITPHLFSTYHLKGVLFYQMRWNDRKSNTFITKARDVILLENES